MKQEREGGKCKSCSCPRGRHYIRETKMAPPYVCLPCRFGPLDLLGDPQGQERVPLLLEPQQHSLSWSSCSRDVLQQRAADGTFVEAAEAALRAAHKASWPHHAVEKAVSDTPPPHAERDPCAAGWLVNFQFVLFVSLHGVGINCVLVLPGPALPCFAAMPCSPTPRTPTAQLVLPSSQSQARS